MPSEVVCLRPEDDFLKVGVTPPDSLSIHYLSPDDSELAIHLAEARALLIPAVGPVLPAKLFDGSRIELVQVTGAGVDRLDEDAMKAQGIAVANVPGGSAAAVAEYAVSSTILLLRRICWADAELRKGNYVEARINMVAENLSGLEGLTVGVVGLGIIGMAVAKAFQCMGSRIVYHDPAIRDTDPASQLGARELPLNELLDSADIVSLHVPLLSSTKSMIGDNELEQMKSGAPSLTVGVVGLGIIGMAVAKAFQCMGSRIVYHDPAIRDTDPASQLGARELPLNELLDSADIVSLHVPLLSSTKSMIGDNELEQMKSGAILINAARGGIVDEAALPPRSQNTRCRARFSFFGGFVGPMPNCVKEITSRPESIWWPKTFRDWRV